MIENEKIDCVDALVFGLNRTAAWRQKMAARYPRPDVPVIMITAYGDPDTKRKAIEGGAEGLLIKPIDFTLLREEIDTRLEPAV
jgi:CheY-like chemotaxis protein